MKYEFKEIGQCANNDGITVEGYLFDIDFSKDQQHLDCLFDSITYLSLSKMAICKFSNSTMYIYSDGKFVISGIATYKCAESILERF